MTLELLLVACLACAQTDAYVMSGPRIHLLSKNNVWDAHGKPANFIEQHVPHDKLLQLQ